MGDEDEDSVNCQNLWKHYFLKDITAAEQVVVTEKVNGEAAHIGATKIGGETFFCIGSKNVHLLGKTKSDVEKYPDPRFQVARIVAETFFNTFIGNNEISQDKRNAFIQFLQNTKYTSVLELLQPANQHVEDLSYLRSPDLRFICWTRFLNDDHNKTTKSLCSIPPNKAIDMAKQFGLHHASYTKIPAADAEREMAKIRGDTGYEGRVLYFLDSEDNVFGIIKKKTVWYIILRALREKACLYISNKNSCSQSDMDSKVTKRITEIQVWIGFSDPYRRTWTEIGTTFVKWLVNLVKRKPSENIAIRAQFPQLWKRFLDSHEALSRKFEALTYEEQL